ncbi:hypothetical protein QQS21_006441 [Conoideocrella luteorostrata]|uniref:Heterokaryon incompatibility domain-containing protein n=1 Tax=Conoideocrella luteorostrata TaxID=1105319 RepID=A0AAJ0CRX0_9HYPO|nr:hypothetical protein QQS21_006441 [Conoideocrella luteorostrata]
MKKLKTIFKNRRSSKQFDSYGVTTSRFNNDTRTPSPSSTQGPMTFPYSYGPAASPDTLSTSSSSSTFDAESEHTPTRQHRKLATRNHQRRRQSLGPVLTEDEPYSFDLQIERDLWPIFEVDTPTDHLLLAAGKINLDFSNRLATAWAHGYSIGGRFGNPLFSGSVLPGMARPPPLLFDLLHHRVVRTAELGSVTYAAISHVWGQTTSIDGSRYGVSWNIPVQSETKLLQILEAARVIVGERYVWMDVLCLDQRVRNEPEIAQMKSYFANATGCFVWLDNTFDDPGWDQVLNAIEHINASYWHDRHGAPFLGALNEVIKGGSLFDPSFNEQDCIAWVRRMEALGNAPWFKRVWTLQEGVIPDNVYFCTPERYMFSGTFMWQISAVIETVACSLLRDDGNLIGTAFAHDLQRSEVHKMLKLRQAYRGGAISYWHLAQAVRTRHCKFEQDRILGVLGLVHGVLPTVSYHRTVDELYQDLYRAYLADGDFKACMFIGGRSQLPEVHGSVGVIASELHGREESHMLESAPNGIHFKNVGYDYVIGMNCIFGTGVLATWHAKFGHILEWSADQQRELARAFNLPDDVHSQTGLCPGAIAAYSAFVGQNILPEHMDYMADIWEVVQAYEPMALLEWIRAGALLNRDLPFDSALVLLVTQSRDTQLAVLTEEVDDPSRLIALMPASYGLNPGAGCIVGRLLPSGEVKKIGVGLGRKLRHSGVAKFTLVD